jgi:hypothetical protein
MLAHVSAPLNVNSSVIVVVAGIFAIVNILTGPRATGGCTRCVSGLLASAILLVQAQATCKLTGLFEKFPQCLFFDTFWGIFI